uniref:BSD2 cysteine rich domain-containing protein n=1 Tax=Kalanchoe fedtschenkoi TaxID=63787 RepID=A0A7N0TDT5_KALFE
MASSICAATFCTLSSSDRPGLLSGAASGRKVVRLNELHRGSGVDRFQSLEVKATPDSGGKTVKPRTLVCPNCEGNGAVACSQCKGAGVNSVDHFNGQFKAGGLCWLCRGKKEMLCGDCNGAGFVGGFMSTHDD